MKSVAVYIDVLMALNLFFNYFSLLAVAKFLYLKVKRKRLVFGALLGAIYSIYIIFPSPGMLLSILVKVLMAISIVYVSFGISKVFKSFLCFLVINLAFAGFSSIIWDVLNVNCMLVHNHVVYFGISPLILVCSTLVAYIIIELINRIIGKHSCEKAFYHIKVAISEKYAVFDACLDTGNNLKEPFSNLPVILVNKSCIKNILPSDVNFEDTNMMEKSSLKLGKKLRLIPFGTILGEGTLLAFKPDNVVIETKSGNINREAYIAICSKVNGAIIGSDMIC
ncbi:MAG: sigma-E processing peptidase SpoIIGA [Oscillospiraceae bacterium]|jgi:stage II sporulation protein GA (sporulation sigma-E factor processing peptidase)|nr:sigma-E processing peptidase SpoIIGA [Oscillospiraceae bacterium]